jgi:hypothetical protein
MSCAMLLRNTKLMLVVVMAKRQIKNSRRLFASSWPSAVTGEVADDIDRPSSELPTLGYV